MVVVNGGSSTELYEATRAEEVAQELQASDPEWNYRAVHDPAGGRSHIEILDEDGVLIGVW
jgi:hypothetical protein